MEMTLSDNPMSHPTPTFGIIERFRRLADSSLFQVVFKTLPGRCQRCHRNHLEEAMALYGGDRNTKHPIIWRCYLERMVYRFVLETLRIWLRIDPSVLRMLLSEKHTRHFLVNYLRGFAEFGVGTPQASGAPVIVVWEITRSCNLSCVYCHVDANQYPMKNELTRREKFALVHQVAESGTSALMIAGGEPLTSPDLADMIHEAHQEGLYTVLISNGTLLTADYALTLRRAGLDYIKISIDSVSPRIHDTLRGKGCWEKAIAGIHNAINGGIDTGIAITATRANFGEIAQTIQMAKDLGCKRVIVFNFVPRGRAGYRDDLDLNGERRRKMLHLIMTETRSRILGEGPLEISTTAPQAPLIADRILGELSFNTLARGSMNLLPYGRIQAGAAFFSTGCSAGITVLAVDADGSIRPCDMLPLLIGNVREKSLIEIWTRDPILKQLRDRRNIRGWCGNCSIRDKCGGCRARAYTYFGDLFGPDPHCWKHPSLPPRTSGENPLGCWRHGR